MIFAAGVPSWVACSILIMASILDSPRLFPNWLLGDRGAEFLLFYWFVVWAIFYILVGLGKLVDSSRILARYFFMDMCYCPYFPSVSHWVSCVDVIHDFLREGEYMSARKVFYTPGIPSVPADLLLLSFLKF